VGDKLCSLVGGDVTWDTVLGEDMENKELCQLWRCDGIVG